MGLLNFIRGLFGGRKQRRDVDLAIATGKQIPVASSNVVSVGWRPGRAIMGSVPDATMTSRWGAASGAGPFVAIGDPVLSQRVVTSNVPVAFSNDSMEVKDSTLGTLLVTFGARVPQKSLYQYFDVPKSVFAEFLRAPSKGKFVWRRLRGKYSYRKVR